MELYEIKDLKNMLGLNADDNMTYTAKSLLGPGENYGSTMLAVDVTTTRKDHETTEHYVAKMCPPNELLKEFFEVQLTYRKEIAFYSQIVPTLQDFLKENGIADAMNVFSKAYGARISLDPKADQVDDDAVLLLENLKYGGYEVVDRLVGLDLECAEFILKKLAVFHAVPLALKIKHRDDFKKKILPSVSTYFKFKLDDKSMSENTAIILAILKEDDKCAQYITRVELAMKRGKINLHNDRPPNNELYGTLVHNDLWVNNIMLKFQNGKPEKCVMVDFQIIEYGNLANDVVFFLFSCIHPKILEKNLDKLLDMYHKTFVKTLQKLSCNTIKYTFRDFEEQLAMSAKDHQFFHIMFMLAPILKKREASKELSEFNHDDFIYEGERLADDFPERVRYIVKEFAKRNWI